MKYQTVSMEWIEIRSHDHWFDPGAMRFFRSRLPKTGAMLEDGRALFISSEQYDAYSPRLYTLRCQATDGSIDTVGDFQAYRSRRQATVALRAYAAGEMWPALVNGHLPKTMPGYPRKEATA